MSTPLLYLSADTVYRALPMSEAIDAMRDAFALLARGEVTLPTRLRLDCAIRTRGGACDAVPLHVARTLLDESRHGVRQERGSRPPSSPVDSHTHRWLHRRDAGSHGWRQSDRRSHRRRLRPCDGFACSLRCCVGGRDRRGRAGTHATGGCLLRAGGAVCAGSMTARGAARRFADEMHERLGISVEPAASPSEAMADAAVVCTATMLRNPRFRRS